MRPTISAIMLAALASTGCSVVDNYEGPAVSDTSAATVIAGVAAEDNFLGPVGSLQIVAVDGIPSGRAGIVRVAPGEHSFRIRHFDGYALIAGNTTHEMISFATEAGHAYEIRGAYCCGYFFGDLDVNVVDRTTEQQVAVREPDERQE